MVYEQRGIIGEAKKELMVLFHEHYSSPQVGQLALRAWIWPRMAIESSFQASRDFKRLSNGCLRPQRAQLTPLVDSAVAADASCGLSLNVPRQQILNLKSDQRLSQSIELFQYLQLKNSQTYAQNDYLQGFITFSENRKKSQTKVYNDLFYILFLEPDIRIRANCLFKPHVNERLIRRPLRQKVL